MLAKEPTASKAKKAKKLLKKNTHLFNAVENEFEGGKGNVVSFMGHRNKFWKTCW